MKTLVSVQRIAIDIILAEAEFLQFFLFIIIEIYHCFQCKFSSSAQMRVLAGIFKAMEINNSDIN